MTWHAGRLIDHVHLVVGDLQKAKRFYGAVAATLGIAPQSGDDYFQLDELYISEPVAAGSAISHVHLAFQAADRDMVHRLYAAMLGAGGVDNGAPGERAYHPGYYAAFVFDPDGNNIEAVHHGPARRSAASVEIEAGGL